MTAREKTDIAFDIYADCAAIIGNDSRRLAQIKDFLYEAVGGQEQKKTDVYHVMAYLGAKPSHLIGVFSSFEKAKKVLYNHLVDYIEDLKEDAKKDPDLNEEVEWVRQGIRKLAVYEEGDFWANNGYFTTHRDVDSNSGFSYDITAVPLDEEVIDIDYI